MNNEIKEILDRLLKYFKESNINDFGYEQDKLISYEEAQILLDYITNLQEENENLKLSLKDRLKYSDELDEKIERIDKAIEYIITHREAVDEKDQTIIYWLSDDFDEEDILNILQGGNNE